MHAGRASDRGTGHWRTHAQVRLTAGEQREHRLPDGFQAYWVRFRTSHDATLTATLEYR